MAIHDGNNEWIMTGNYGEPDIFKFREGHGNDIIVRFDPYADAIDLTGFSQPFSWDELKEKISINHWWSSDMPYTTMKIHLGEWGGGSIEIRNLSGHLGLEHAEEFLTLPPVPTIEGGNDHDSLQGTDGDDVILGYGKSDNIRGEGGDDQLFGGEGRDVISGGKGDDLIVGGTENDQLWGGEGADRFVVHPGDGNDTIHDFYRQDGDKIDLSAFNNIRGISDLEISGSSSSTRIKLPSGETIELSNCDVSTVDESDFTFTGEPDAYY